MKTNAQAVNNMLDGVQNEEGPMGLAWRATIAGRPEAFPCSGACLAGWFAFQPLSFSPLTPSLYTVRSGPIQILHYERVMHIKHTFAEHHYISVNHQGRASG